MRLFISHSACIALRCPATRNWKHGSPFRSSLRLKSAYTLAALLGLSFACGGSRPAESTLPVDMSTPGGDGGDIILGKSIGGVTLGMTRAEVETVLGPPKAVLGPTLSDCSKEHGEGVLADHALAKEWLGVTVGNNKEAGLRTVHCANEETPAS